ncbi:nucleotide exchange factor GrpE [Aerococcaceae bacterium INB8]|uniref:Protein GrpE n=1 Tax=Ruoffia halotolerans TaxID=2748684 RepID=A0A839A4T1_9LACT|nr:nucleotide exchange factor GrpE [Ruoffia halotolerans]
MYEGGCQLTDNEKNNNVVDESVEIIEPETSEETTSDTPEVSEEETQEVSELDKLKQENEELDDKILRLQAEIANMRRINSRERSEAAKFRSQNLASSLLEVIDNLERALQTETTSEDGEALKKGVEMVHNQFKYAFEKEKIETIDPLNEEFDPNFHQAVSVMPVGEGQESNHVIQVLQKGYRIDNRVIRPAMVIVSE